MHRTEPKLAFREELSDLTTNDFVTKKQEKVNPNVIDCFGGDPHSILPGYIDILQKCAVPPNNEQDYYKYSTQTQFNEQREHVANRLNADTPIKGYKWAKDNIVLTTGAISALYISISTLCCKNDEIIVLRPWWPLYPKMIRFNQGIMKVVDVNMNDHTYNNMNIIKSIIDAINSKTKAILLNTPHNPVGTIFNEKELVKLSYHLNQKSIKYGTRIWIISDEPYRDIILTQKQKYLSPSIYYPYTIISYSYGKITLAPMQRIGWLAVPPNMNKQHQQQILGKLLDLQWFGGYQIPNIIPGKALIEIENLIQKLKPNLINDYISKNNLIYNTLKTKMNGYSIKNKPLSTFYFMFRPPLRYKLSALEYCDLLFEHENVKLRSIHRMGMPQWVRIAYTNSYHEIQQMCSKLIKFDKYLQSKYQKHQSKL